MSLQFKCPHCHYWIITRYLKVGEVARCRHCGNQIEVPVTAMETDRLPDYLIHTSEQARKTHVRPE